MPGAQRPLDTATPHPRHILDAHSSLRLVVAFGIVSLFADMTCEGMRSIAGPYLALLGASGLTRSLTPAFRLR